MSIHQLVEGGYIVDLTPVPMPDGKFAARALVTRQGDQHIEELRPEFSPFLTEVEAASAAHMAALAWIAHRSSGTQETGRQRSAEPG